MNRIVELFSRPEFSKIHFVPFQDTLPAAQPPEMLLASLIASLRYEYDIFNDYLKPYLTRNKLQTFGINDHFTFQDASASHNAR